MKHLYKTFGLFCCLNKYLFHNLLASFRPNCQFLLGSRGKWISLTPCYDVKANVTMKMYNHSKITINFKVVETVWCFFQCHCNKLVHLLFATVPSIEIWILLFVCSKYITRVTNIVSILSQTKRLCEYRLAKWLLFTDLYAV